MKLGIIGIQNSGKTTIFNALTGQNAEITSYASQKADPNLGMVDVLDPRITKLSQMYEPKKTIYANIEFIDFGGLTGESTGDAFSANALALLKNTDALALVVRNFMGEFDTSEPNPMEDIEKTDSELIISDLIIAEKRLEKIILSNKRGIKDAAIVIEEKAIRRILDHLNEDKPIRTLELAEEEEKSVRGFRFSSQKPLMIILNSDEDKFGNNSSILAEIDAKYKVIEFAGNFEMELINLEADEAKEFMDDMGISESARNRLTAFAYETLGYISFFTVGKDEVRAWTITQGDDAVEAAGKIHSDLARGFIRAECFSFDDLIEAGSEKGIKEKGLFRLEGKTYIVQNGDLLNIRFSV